VSFNEKLLPEKLSPTRLKDYLQCPKLFYYKSVLRLPVKGSIHTLKGEVVHTVLEMIFNHPRDERGVERAVSYVRGAVNVYVNPTISREKVTDKFELQLRDYLNLFERDRDLDEKLEKKSFEAREIIELNGGIDDFTLSIYDLVNQWYGMENPIKFDPEEREMHVEAEIGGYKVQGYIDRLDAFLKFDSKEYFISDYKTGSVPSEKYLDDAFFAMKIYALLLRKSRGIQAKALRLIYVKQGDLSGVKKLDLNDKVILETEKKVKSVIRNIKNDFRNDKWSTRKGPLCGWCNFQDICPAFNKNEIDSLEIT